MHLLAILVSSMSTLSLACIPSKETTAPSTAMNTTSPPWWPEWLPWGSAANTTTGTLPSLPPIGSLFTRPPNGYGSGMQPGGAGRPPPPHNRWVEGLTMPDDILAANGGEKPNCLYMTIGDTDDSELGNFCVYLFEGKMKEGAPDMKEMALGSEPPRSDDEALASHSGGFAGLDIYTVFPQFVTCLDNVTALQINEYATGDSSSTVQGEIGGDDGEMDPLPFFLAHPGSAMVVVAAVAGDSPGNYYFIASNMAQLVGLEKYRPIGYISVTDMLFVTALKVYTCFDYETVVDSITRRRRKRSTGSIGFTACSVK